MRSLAGLETWSTGLMSNSRPKRLRMWPEVLTYITITRHCYISKIALLPDGDRHRPELNPAVSRDESQQPAQPRYEIAGFNPVRGLQTA